MVVQDLAFSVKRPKAMPECWGVRVRKLTLNRQESIVVGEGVVLEG